jgi:nitroreductase
MQLRSTKENMDILQAIKSRHTVRAFQPVPVSKELLEELLKIATQAPSWANSQTWEFAVVGGSVMEKIKQALMTKVSSQEKRQPDIPLPKWPPDYQKRIKENGLRLYQALDINHEDKEKQLEWFVLMHEFFGAPNCIMIFTEKGSGEWGIFNIGLLVQNIALAALKYGLGTAVLAAGVSFPGEIKELLNIPESKQLVISVAIGYPDTQSEINSFRSSRVPLETNTTWHGF